MDIAGWLRALGLERYEAAFRENDVNAELLPKLTGDDLKELGVTSVGHRRQILDAIASLAPRRQRRLMVPFSYQPACRVTSGAVGDRWRTPPADRDVLRPGGFDGAE